MPALNHIHSYAKWKKRGIPLEQYWKCVDANCTHTIAQSLVKGKNTLCPQCKITVFQLSWEDDLLRRAVPKCINCRETAVAKEHKVIKSLVQDLFKDEDKEREKAS